MPERPPEPSVAWARPDETDLGRRAAPLARAHPGQSGIYALSSGLDAFAARVLLVEAAEAAVDVQYYIFHDDVTGRLLLERMLAAADRGVRVRLLLDDLGSSGIDPILGAADAHPRIEVRLFNPVRRGAVVRQLDLVGRAPRLNHRMHNKLLAIDGAAAVVGGRNVGDEYFDASEGANFADSDLLVFGAVVPELGASFDRYWNSPYAVPAATFAPLRREPEALEALRSDLAAHVAEHRDSAYARRARSSRVVQDAASERIELLWAPTAAYSDLPRKIEASGDEVEATLLATKLRPLFDRVRSELLIVSPYFIPGDSGSDYLIRLRERGVRVRLLTNSLAATDVPAVHAGYERYRKRLLEAGVEIFELRRSGEAFVAAERAGLMGSSTASLHAKTFGIDGATVFVGSMNLDPRSVQLNTELGLVIESAELADHQTRAFERVTAPEYAWQVELEDGELVWRAGDARWTSEPDTSWGSRVGVGLLGLLPVEGQL